MGEPKNSDPTKPELAILKLLWSADELTARDIHSAIERKFDWSYSTVRTVLERMNEKGLISKAPAGAANVYSAEVGKVALLGKMIADFSARVMELEAPPAAALFAESKLLDDAELAELEEVLRNADDQEADQ
ncbi:MAG: BlaI/MecI/CopY family transcriptional regulator [Pseudomonadota bacterium]